MCAKWAYKNPCMAAQLPLYVCECVCVRECSSIFLWILKFPQLLQRSVRRGESCHCNDSNQSVQHLASSSGAAAGANFDCTKHLHARTCRCCCCWPCQTVQFALLVHKLCTIDGNCCAWSRVRLQLRLWASVSHWPQYKLHIEIHTFQYNTIHNWCTLCGALNASTHTDIHLRRHTLTYTEGIAVVSCGLRLHFICVQHANLLFSKLVLVAI